MSKYLNTHTGHVVERPDSYVRAFSDGHFVPADEDADVYVEPCCGATYEDELEYSDEKENE